jgi:hypothetical protein
VNANRKAELLTVVCVCAIAFALGVVFVRQYESRPGPQSVIAHGMRLSALAGYDWRSHPQTLILVLRVGCPYCESSMDFYQRLLALERARELNVHLLAAFPDSEAAITGQLSGRMPGVPIAANVSLDNLGVAGTPTLILADDGGEVRDVWVGQLSSVQEEGVIEAIGASARSVE